MFKTLLLVGAGSFLGGALRYVVTLWMKGVCHQGFPWGTLLVNLLGCFLLGLIVGAFGRCNALSSPWCLMLSIGVCGGFTTFSTFANESLQMLQGGDWLHFIAYVSVSVIAGICLTAFGYGIVAIR